MKKPIREPERDNDYINMSSINIYSQLHKNRAMNQKINDKYQKDYQNREEARQDPTFYTRLALQELEDQKKLRAGGALPAILGTPQPSKSLSITTKFHSTAKGRNCKYLSPISAQR